MIQKLKKCNILIFIYYLFFILVLMSLYQYLNVLDNKCMMTFMFETPNFIPVPLPKKLETDFNKYKIYAYKEGKKDNKFSYSDFNGFPVIFIPGSSGSFRQVRSFASVSMDFYRHFSTKSNLDFFAIDFNEEFSGVYGPYLQNQTVFLNQAIKVIKRLYYRKQSEVQLIVIAHSFGGIIFKGLINLPSFKLDDIFLFLSLATPHRNSVFAFDSSFFAYYSQINQRLQTNDQSIYEKYRKIAKISIGGGLNDNLVRSDLTIIEDHVNRLQQFNSNITESNQWSLTSNSLPEVWVAADHQCIVWCKQLVMKLEHLIFDLLEESLIDKKMLNRNQIIDHHLNYRFNDRMTPRFWTPSSLSDDKKAKKYDIEKRFFILDKPKVIDTSIYEFKFVKNSYFSIVSTNLHRSIWIFACKQNDLDCQNVQNFTNLPIPTFNPFNGIKKNHFLLDSNLYLDQNYTRMNLKISTSTIRTGFQFERIIAGRRDKQVDMPGVFSRLWFLNPFQTVLKISVGEESIYYNLVLNNFNQIWHNYNLKLEIGKCYSQAKEDTVLIMNVPWYKEDRFYAIESRKESTFNTVLNLNVPKYDKNDNRKITLKLILDPFCEYRLKIKFSLRETIIQLFRHYTFLFLPIGTSILLSAYSIQIRSNQHTKSSKKDLSKNLSKDELSKNEFTTQKTEHYATLKSILIYKINELTYFGLQPALPYLIHLSLNNLFARFGYSNFLDLNLLFIKHTRHNSHIDSLFSSYLIFIFIYFILFITIHLFSSLFSLLINFNQFIYLNRNHLQFISPLLSQYTKSTHLFNYSNFRSLPRLILILTFLLSIYLKLVAYVLVLIYLFKILMLSSQSTANQHKIGLQKSTTRFYLDITKFMLILISFIPLIPKFIVCFMTNELLLDKTIIFYKICFVLSLIQLNFSIDHDVSDKRNSQLSYVIRFLAIVCLCLGQLDYTVITISLIIILILRSVLELNSCKFRFL